MLYRVGEEELSSITSADLPPARTWVALCLTGPADYRLMTGSGPTGIYTVRVSRAYPHWGMAVMDFLTFHQETGSGVLLSISDRDWREAQKAYEGHSCRDGFLRDDEPAVARPQHSRRLLAGYPTGRGLKELGCPEAGEERLGTGSHRACVGGSRGFPGVYHAFERLRFE